MGGRLRDKVHDIPYLTDGETYTDIPYTPSVERRIGFVTQDDMCSYHKLPWKSSSSFDTVNLNGGLQELWFLLAMTFAYRLTAYLCLRRKISICHL